MESLDISAPTRNLALDLARVTEAAALAAGRWMGRGNKEAADHAAVEAMRLVLSTISIDGIIVIGEGEKDSAPMLYNGEKVGNGQGPQVDVAVDPIDGTRPLAYGRTNSIATVAIAPHGAMFNPGPYVYMNKIAVGPEAKGKINIEVPITENLKAIAKAKGKSVEDLRDGARRGSSASASAGRPRVCWRPAPCAPWAERSRASCLPATRTNCTVATRRATTSRRS